MISLESPTNAPQRTVRRIHGGSKRASRSTSAKPVRASSAAPSGIRTGHHGQPSGRVAASLRVKPRRFRLRNLVRSTVLMGVGVVIGACSIWHPHAVAGRVEGFHSAAVANQTKVQSVAAISGKMVGASRIAGLWTAVEPGDTVWSLAERYGSQDRPIRDSVQDILRWNHLHEDASLRVGQSIQVAK